MDDARVILTELKKAKLYVYLSNSILKMKPIWEEFTAQVHGLKISVEKFRVQGMKIGNNSLKIWSPGCPLPPDDSKMQNNVLYQNLLSQVTLDGLETTSYLPEMPSGLIALMMSL